MTEPWFDAPAPLLPEILALNGRWMGDKPAVVCGERVLTWRQLHRQLCQVANGLRAAGLDTGDRVAVLMDNSPEMLVTLFGIIVAGDTLPVKKPDPGPLLHAAAHFGVDPADYKDVT